MIGWIKARPAWTLALVLTARAVPAAAQVDELGIGGGVAVPVYETAVVHDPGPHLLVYAGRTVSSRLQLRGELGFAWLAEGTRDPSQGPPPGDLRAFRLSGVLVYSPAGTERGVYGFAGGGLFALRTSSETAGDPPFVVPGVSVGVGVRFRVAGQALFAQTGAEVPFSTFATGTESAPNMYLPFAVGLRIPWGGGGTPRP